MLSPPAPGVTFGSDDLIHPVAFELLCEAGQTHDAAGFMGAYFLCTRSWRAGHLEYPHTSYRPCGAGRILQRHVLDQLDWAPRSDASARGLDGSMDKALQKIGVQWHIIRHKSIEAPVLDVKTWRNLTSFNSLLGAGADELSPEDICDAFGEPWAERLRALKPDPQDIRLDDPSPMPRRGSHPGHLVNVDAQTGEGAQTHLFVATDDYTQAHVSETYTVCDEKTAIRFVDEMLKQLSHRVFVIQTDNVPEFQSAFHQHLESLDICHVYHHPGRRRTHVDVAPEI